MSGAEDIITLCPKDGQPCPLDQKCEVRRAALSSVKVGSKTFEHKSPRTQRAEVNSAMGIIYMFSGQNCAKNIPSQK